MSSLNAEVRTINSIEEVSRYVTAGSWIVWDLEGTLFQFQDEIPYSWLTDKTQQEFDLCLKRADRTLALTGSYSYLYLTINNNLEHFKAHFYYAAKKKNEVINFNQLFKSFEYNGVCYAGLQDKGTTLKHYLDQVDKKDLPSTIVFVDDALKHVISVSQVIQKYFPSINMICLHYQQN